MIKVPLNSRSLARSLLFERIGWRFSILLLSFFSALFGLLAPYAQKIFADELIAGRAALGWIFVAFLCLVAYHGLWQLNVWLATRESLISQKSLGDGAFHRLLEGPGGLLGRAPAGVAVSLFAVDVPGATALLDQSLLMFSSLAFPVLLAPVVLHTLFGIPWWASIGSLIFLSLIQFLFALRQSRFFLAFKQLAAERTGLVSEWIQNIRILRILGWTESTEEKIFTLRRKETANRKKMVTNGQIMNSIASSSTFCLNLLAVLLLLQLRGKDHSSPSPGELLALLWILGVFLARPLRQLPWMLVMTFDGMSSLRRLENAFRIPISKPELAPRPGASLARKEEKDCTMEVRGLRLASEGKVLLKDINLCLKKGSITALVGEVGSGKSLLLNSLIGGTGALFDEFRINGKATQGPLDPEVLGKIAFVPQEGFTISASLLENVAFDYLKNPGSSLLDGAMQSLLLSQFDPREERVANGLESEIGERGVNLSGGQRQRVSLARAHFSRRKILLLDDCLSAVDVETERRLIRDLFLGAWRDRTILLATHRLAILPRCEEIIFLVDGAVEISGKYEDLLSRSEKFRNFVSREEIKSPDATEEPIQTVISNNEEDFS